MTVAYGKECPFDTLVGKTLTKVQGLSYGSECVLFTCDTGEVFAMSHWQSCCETVSIDDVNGEVEDLIGARIEVASEDTSYDQNAFGGTCEDSDSQTWTFYTIRTLKGTVSIRWLGSSNGYYSESVAFGLAK